MKVVLPAIILVAVILAVSVALAHSSCAKPDVQFDNTGLAQTNEDPKVYVAVEHAKATLPQFIQALRHPKRGDIGFGVQTAFNTPNGPEHIWVRVRKYSDGQFNGKLANEPEAIPGMHEGDPVTVKESDVTDWIYQSNGKQVGGYTMEAIKSEAGGK